MLGAVRPSTDTLLIRVELGKDDGDPFVLCVAQKKHATRLAKEMHDLVSAEAKIYIKFSYLNCFSCENDVDMKHEIPDVHNLHLTLLD